MTETLLYAFIASISFNLIMFLIAFYFKTDKLTDISYSLTFIFLTFFGVLRATSDGDLTLQQQIVAALVLIWAARIGSYLLYRIRAIGKDARFDERRNSFVKFGGFWLLQGLTCWVVMIGALLFITEGVAVQNAYFGVGVALFALGLAVETVADLQKFNFIQNKKNKGKWIDSGLWAYSRHPNYFGEIVLWLGMHVAVVSGLPTANQQMLASVSPLFIAFLLLFVSGVPLLEQSADKKWGKNKKYQQYKATTSLLIPLPKAKK